ncbi:hypothetical protein V5O48_009235 [Marasmius crinis-equi]|uniref:Uncharacterized protein n=1 Tax=Marasmius crinis-equi TaxID=585013 RepID=A0ABR3FCB8_9AGAR
MSYIAEHQPFKDLPPQYWNDNIFRIIPPVFDYGIAVLLSKVVKTAQRLGIIQKNEKLEPGDFGILVLQIAQFIEKHLQLPPASVKWIVPLYGPTTALYTLTTNYGSKISNERLPAAIRDTEKLLKRRAKWYLSGDNKEEDLIADYSTTLEELEQAKARCDSRW